MSATSYHSNPTEKGDKNERHNRRSITVCNYCRFNGFAAIGRFFSTDSNAITRGLNMNSAYKKMIEKETKTRKIQDFVIGVICWTGLGAAALLMAGLFYMFAVVVLSFG